MKNENNIISAIAGFSLLLSSVALAGTAPTAQKNERTVPEMKYTLTLEKLIQENTEKKRLADAEKYTQLTMLAGNRKNELVRSRDEVANTYKAWRDLKTVAESSSNTRPNNFKDIEAAALAYSQANKAFVDLQKDILAKSGIPSGEVNTRIVVNLIPDAIDALNTVPATAAGSR